MTKKTAMISGASRGIGRGIACRLAEEGYDLHLTCLSSIKELTELKEELEDMYRISCRVGQCDMRDYESVLSFFEGIKEVDVLVNNAGISFTGLLADTTLEQWHEVIDTNLSSVFYTCRLAVPLMIRKKKGRIINISSVWGSVGASMETAYSASKGGVNSLTKALAKELAPSHICVNAIACGFIDTQMNQCYDGEERRQLKEEIPADRFGECFEVADMVQLLIKAPEYMTGQIISLDGGWI